MACARCGQLAPPPALRVLGWMAGTPAMACGEARTAGTLICLTLRSGAIHSSDAAPLLKKLSCTAALSVRCSLDVHECCRGILSSLITLY